jgi:hypothetical protein
LAARKFLEKYYPGESTFVDISDYASRINGEEEVEDESEVDFSLPKVEKVPGGCLHFAISLEPEAHPLAEDRVATIALLGALDLPVPDSLKAKLSGSIQNVYFVIERGFSRTVSRSTVDCEGCPEFEENVSPQVFQGNQAALVEFDQENSIVTVKLHRKAPPKSKAMQYQPQEKPEEDDKEDEDAEEEPEEEDLDDINDELIAFCEFNLWDLIDIERGNHQVDLVERITQTFDCLTPDDAVRVLNNECHPSMVNFYGRSLIELGDQQDAIKEGVAEIKEGGFMNFFVGKVKGALKDKAEELKGKAQDFVEDKLQGVADAAMQYISPQDDDEEDENEEPVDDEEDDEALELTNKIFLAKQQLQRSIQNLGLVAGQQLLHICAVFRVFYCTLGGQSQESCGNIVKLYDSQLSVYVVSQLRVTNPVVLSGTFSNKLAPRIFSILSFGCNHRHLGLLSRNSCFNLIIQKKMSKRFAEKRALST